VFEILSLAARKKGFYSMTQESTSFDAYVNQVILSKKIYSHCSNSQSLKSQASLKV
jgi:hypothetical protein